MDATQDLLIAASTGTAPNAVLATTETQTMEFPAATASSQTVISAVHSESIDVPAEDIYGGKVCHVQ